MRTPAVAASSSRGAHASSANDKNVSKCNIEGIRDRALFGTCPFRKSPSSSMCDIFELRAQHDGRQTNAKSCYFRLLLHVLHPAQLQRADCARHLAGLGGWQAPHERVVCCSHLRGALWVLHVSGGCLPDTELFRALQAMADTLHFEDDGDVFYQEVRGLAPGGNPAPVALVKATDGSMVYIAYNVISSSLKSQGLKIGHSTMWASLAAGGVCLRKRKGAATRDGPIIAAIQKAARAHYKKQSAYQMTLVPVTNFINYIHTKAGWQPMLVMQALGSGAGRAWLQKAPSCDLDVLTRQLSPAPVVFAAPPAPHEHGGGADGSDAGVESDGAGTGGSGSAVRDDERAASAGAGSESGSMYTASSASEHSTSVDEDEDDCCSDDDTCNGSPQHADGSGGASATTSGSGRQRQHNHPRPTDNPDGAWSTDGSWGLEKRQKLAPITHIFEEPPWLQKTFKFHTWCSVLDIRDAVMKSSHEPKHKHFVSWMHNAKGGLSQFVRSVPNLATNPYLAYTVCVPLADGGCKWGFELYMVWCSQHAQLTAGSKAERMVSAGLVLEWLLHDEYEHAEPMKQRVRGLLEQLEGLEKRFGNGTGRKHHTRYHDNYMNAFQLSHLMEYYAEPKITTQIRLNLQSADSCTARGWHVRANQVLMEAAMRKHDLVKVKLLNFSVPPMTRPGFMKTLQVRLDRELSQSMPNVPQPVCHRGCGRAGCCGNVVHFADDGSVLMYFPHFKNEGKLDPGLNFKLNNALARELKEYVLPRAGQPLSCWQRLTNTAQTEQDKSLLFGIINTVSGKLVWRPMQDPTMSTMFWCVALGCPRGPMREFVGADDIKAEWAKAGLADMLEGCEPSPPQRIRNMIASAAVMLMDIGESAVLQLVADKQNMDAVLDLVGGAMLSGKSSLHHYTAAEGQRMLQAGVQLLSLIRKHNNNSTLLATRSVRLTMQQPE